MMWLNFPVNDGKEKNLTKTWNISHRPYNYLTAEAPNTRLPDDGEELGLFCVLWADVTYLGLVVIADEPWLVWLKWPTRLQKRK